jgi:hypothetical protein
MEPITIEWLELPEVGKSEEGAWLSPSSHPNGKPVSFPVDDLLAGKDHSFPGISG